MPLYEYECAACGHRFELIQRFSDPAADTCTACGAGPVHKLLSAPAIHFKGTGWYVTDYGKKGSDIPAETSKAASAAKGESSAKTDSPSKSDSSSKAESSSKTESSSAATKTTESKGSSEKPASRT